LAKDNALMPPPDRITVTVIPPLIQWSSIGLPIKSSYIKPIRKTINGVSVVQKQTCNYSNECLGEIQSDNNVRTEFKVEWQREDCIVSESATITQLVGDNTYCVSNTISGTGNGKKVKFMEMTKPSLEAPDHNTPRVTVGHHHRSTTFFNKIQLKVYKCNSTHNRVMLAWMDLG
jgi:hypothetical protein